MRLVRRRRLIENMRGGISKVLLFVATAILCLWMVSGARAAPLQIADIKTHPAANGGETIQIIFNEAVKEDQVLAEFQRNFLQLSIRGASAFPAKNTNVNGHTIDKIFIYQYQPDLARARVLFKVDAAGLKDRIHWAAKGNAIEINFEGNLVPQATAAVKTLVPSSKAPQKNARVHADTLKGIASSASRELPKEENKNDPLVKEDERLIKQILEEPNTANLAIPTAGGKKISAAETNLAAPSSGSTESEPLFPKSEASAKLSAKADNPIRKMATGLLTVLALMAAIAYGFKRFVLQGKLAGLTRQGKVIDMVSSYMISPKKSIAVMRVGKQLMVIGITDQNINLIQNLGDDAGIDNYLSDGLGDSVAPGFSSILSKKFSSDSSETEESAERVVSKPSMRSKIKQRIEGFKPL